MQMQNTIKNDGRIVTHVKQHEIIVPGKRLGRHVLIDPKSAGYRLSKTPSKEIGNVTHVRNVPIFDQGEIGSCEGNAWAGAISTGPFIYNLNENNAVQIYAKATTLDNIYGTYPPDDTGTSTIAAAKACRSLGLIKGWANAFHLTEMLQGLMGTSCVFACDWYEGFDDPSSTGLVKAKGSARGGHAFEAVQIKYRDKRVRFANSWGTSYGDKGYFEMAFATIEALFRTGADCSFPIV